ncbi:glucosamine-6-phosphate deaminase [candidate division KSB1 bacterium]|nr:glucosamine-6-phosphate deaminase [candidate division KSB1 bacterium]
MENFMTLPESKVEQTALKKSGRQFMYQPTEKIAVIEVDNFPALGKLTAMRFLEWVQYNPEGVISLPTGRTPEHFIKWVKHYIQNWGKEAVAAELEEFGLDTKITPRMDLLRFVQIDEFYPINPTHSNSFSYYIKKFYIDSLGLDIKKALLINAWTTGVPENSLIKEIFPDNIVDLSLRTRFERNSLERLQKSVIERVDQYCTEYETRIRDMGGIGFFIGGIGPDGHIGFNVHGSDHYSTTRLTATNYETQAAAAVDLGGIEIARNRLVITIGLSTITQNPDTVAIIIAAGESKAKVIQEAVESEISNLYPATVLQKLKNSRFYLTKGAALLLTERQCEDLKKNDSLPRQTIEKIIIDLAVRQNKSIQDLKAADFDSTRSARSIAKAGTYTIPEMIQTSRDSLKAKIERGLAQIENERFLHTAPHHDDIMLGYWAYIMHLTRTPLNIHHFAYMTSGFNAVTNAYVHELLNILLKHLDTPAYQQFMDTGYFDPSDEIARNRDVYRYLDGVAAHRRTMQEDGEARRLLRNLMFLFEETSPKQLKNRVRELIMYFETQYPGKKDLPYIQQFKGMIREWEADLLWGYLGFSNKNVFHLRLGFYKGDIFTEEPSVERDVPPVLELLEKVKPTTITVALDPEASGPDTHYKVLQIISEALKIYQEKTGRKDIKIWGYRNVWYRFNASEADIMVPVSLNSLAVLENAFDKCFGSQRNASFPSYELDGPFSRLARKIMVDQYLDIKTCLGREFFYQSTHPRLRACHGLVYIKEMQPDEFYNRTMELRKATEAK